MAQRVCVYVYVKELIPRTDLRDDVDGVVGLSSRPSYFIISPDQSDVIIRRRRVLLT